MIKNFKPLSLDEIREREPMVFARMHKSNLHRNDVDSILSSMKSHRTLWDKDFPDTIIDRGLGEATKHPLYTKAKSGDVESAYELAQDLVTDDAVNKIRELANNQKLLIVPVHAEEAVGRNKIPSAISVVLAKKINADISTDIIQATKVSRTAQDGWYRLANPPAFEGTIKKGSKVLLVDDTQTQGGTFAALKGHVERQGADVVGTYALTGKQYSVQLRLSEKTFTRLSNEYGNIEDWWKSEFGYGFESLTEWEARYILNSRKSPEQVRKEIIAKRPKGRD